MDSDLEREEKDMREEVNRAMARVLRHDDVNKNGCTQKGNQHQIQINQEVSECRWKSPANHGQRCCT